MSIVDLLSLFADPVRLQDLSLSQKMLASLVTTLLGMGITFFALIILQFAIIIMAKLTSIAGVSSEDRKKTGEGKVAIPAAEDSSVIDEEVVAAITVSLSVLLECSPNSLVIRNIRPVENTTPIWNKAGLAEQMHGRA